MFTLFFSLPDTPRAITFPIRVSEASTSESSRMTSSTLFKGIFLSLHANVKVSRTLENAKSVSSCVTYAEISDISNAEWSCLPLIQIFPVYYEPFCFSILPANAFINVVFPAPDGPRIDSKHPGRAIPETLSRIIFLGRFPFCCML